VIEAALEWFSCHLRGSGFYF